MLPQEGYFRLDLIVALLGEREGGGVVRRAGTVTRTVVHVAVRTVRLVAEAAAAVEGDGTVSIAPVATTRRSIHRQHLKQMIPIKKMTTDHFLPLALYDEEGTERLEEATNRRRPRSKTPHPTAFA